MAFREEEGGAAALDLDEHIKAVEEAARDWGVHADALEGRFVSALLAAIAESGRMNRAAVGEVERVLEQAKALGDQEVGRLKIIFAGGEKAIAIAKQAAETAIAAAHRGEHGIQPLRRADRRRAFDEDLGLEPEVAGLEAEGPESP